jgi:hypothetical protein
MDLTGPDKLETIGLLSGAVRLLAQTEIGQRRAGQDPAQHEPLFDRAMTRILTGLLPPARRAPGPP